MDTKIRMYKLLCMQLVISQIDIKMYPLLFNFEYNWAMLLAHGIENIKVV